MKKFFMFLAVAGLFTLTAQYASAQDTTTAAATDTTAAVAAPSAAADQTAQEEVPIHQQLKAKFIEGGAGFMASIILCLIFGLAIAIERIIYLNLATTNTEKLLKQIEEALAKGGVESAKEICRNTKGPVASIFYQGLLRMDEGIEVVEKSVVSYGSVQMSQMESGLSWIGLSSSLSLLC